MTQRLSQDESAAPPEETVISEESGGIARYLYDQYRFRRLLAFFVIKDIKVLRAQTAFGAGWLVLRPLMNVLVLTAIFGLVVRVPSDGAPYLLFILSGMLPWIYFSSTVSKAGGSLVSNANLVTKVYFPRTYMPLSLVGSGLVEFGATFLIFIAISAVAYDQLPGLEILWLPVLLLLLLLTTTGASLWLAALAVDFRDIRIASQHLIQLMMFAAPVVWPISLLSKRLGGASERFLEWYAYYPLVGIVEGFRGALLGTAEIPWDYVLKGYATALVLLVSGFLYFRRRERLLADFV